MAAKDAVEFSNYFLETRNRLPHPQEVWNAAWNAAEEKFLQSGEAPLQAIALVRELSGLLMSTDREPFLLSLAALEAAATAVV